MSTLLIVAENFVTDVATEIGSKCIFAGLRIWNDN